jgi:hypothetical protein
MPRITISYRRGDAPIAARISDRLVARYGHESVFRDVDNIPFGVDFRHHIQEAIANADVVLAIIGPTWTRLSSRGDLRAGTDLVGIELETALEAGVPIIPVLVDDAAMPAALELPGGLQKLAYLNAASIGGGGDFDAEMAALMRAVDRLIGDFETPQVFRAGDPVERHSEAFVPRFKVLSELEGQLTLASGCPGLILYGRRRTGKSTLLRNLIGFLPDRVKVAGTSMQDPRAFTSTGSFVELVSELVAEALQKAPVSPLPHMESARFKWLRRLGFRRVSRSGAKSSDGPRDNSLSGLFEKLSRANEELADGHRRLLLTIDEYENLDRKIGDGAFSTDLLATIRESIQSHRRIVWLFAGSHHIAELIHAPWSSYLVSARTVEVPLFDLDETRLLLTDPLIHSGAFHLDDPRRPRYDELWGKQGIRRIHEEAGGWPHLVQLIAETAIDLHNERAVVPSGPALIDAAIARAVVRGDTALRELVQYESTLPGEWDYIRGFRHQDVQPAPVDEQIYQSIRRRLLVIEDGRSWRLRVPLMQRWLRERG